MAGTGTDAAPRSRVQSQELWRRHHGAAAIEPAGGRGLRDRARSPCGDPRSGRRPEISGVDIVVLHFEVQGLVVHLEEPRRLTLVPARGVKGQADRLALRLGGRPVERSPSGRTNHPRNAIAQGSRGLVSPWQLHTCNSRTSERVPDKKPNGPKP